MRDRIIKARILKTKKSILLLGPRQVGKSTLCRELKPDFAIDLADEEVFLSHSKDPGLLKRLLAAQPQAQTVFIDEIQRIPQLLNTIQALLEAPAHPQRKFILTGSSARKLRRAGTNLLPGRVLFEWLDPLMLSEIGNQFDLDRALSIGALPGVFFDLEEGTQILSSYVEIYLREEIRAEALVRNLGGFARFLDVIALASGQWLNYSKLAGDTEIPKETIRRFVSLLEDTLIVFRLPPYAVEGTRRVTQRDKIFLFDVGVRNAILGIHKRPLTPDQRGSLFEQWFVLQVRALHRAFKYDWRLSSYRTDAGAEVDLVLEDGEHVVGLEIKCSKTVNSSDKRGLVSLGEVLRKGTHYTKWIVFQGDKAQQFADGTWAIPFADALDRLQKCSWNS